MCWKPQCAKKIEKSHVTLTCKQFRPCAVNTTTLPVRHSYTGQQENLYATYDKTVYATSVIFDFFTSFRFGINIRIALVKHHFNFLHSLFSQKRIPNTKVLGNVPIHVRHKLASFIYLYYQYFSTSSVKL
jgi:hypothetical protein